MKSGLIITAILLLIKFLAYYLTHSYAILTDALESVVNLLAGAFALYSVILAAQPKDRNHPYGHGKVEFLSSGIEGGMISIAGIGMVAKGIMAFFDVPELKSMDYGIILTALTGGVNYFIGRHFIKKGEQFQSATMISNGKHLVSDTLSSIGLVAGLLIIYITKIIWIDYVITIVLGIAILYTGVKLIRESISGLLDEADIEKMEALVNFIDQHKSENTIDLHNLRIQKFGHHLHVDCHITLPWYLSLEESHNEVTRIENLVRDFHHGETEFFVHSDPCIPSSCEICSKPECKYRKTPQVKSLKWTMENAIPNQKHGINS